MDFGLPHVLGVLMTSCADSVAQRCASAFQLVSNLLADIIVIEPEQTDIPVDFGEVTVFIDDTVNGQHVNEAKAVSQSACQSLVTSSVPCTVEFKTLTSRVKW